MGRGARRGSGCAGACVSDRGRIRVRAVGVHSPVVAAGDVIDEGLENAALAFFDAVSKCDDVNRDVVLLQAFGEADHEFLVGSLAFERRGDEDDNTLTEVLVGSVFEGKKGLFDGVGDVSDATELLLCGVDCAEDGAELLSICYENFWSRERNSG